MRGCRKRKGLVKVVPKQRSPDDDWFREGDDLEVARNSLTDALTNATNEGELLLTSLRLDRRLRVQGRGTAARG